MAATLKKPNQEKEEAGAGDVSFNAHLVVHPDLP